MGIEHVEPATGTTDLTVTVSFVPPPSTSCSPGVMNEALTTFRVLWVALAGSASWVMPVSKLIVNGCRPVACGVSTTARYGCEWASGAVSVTPVPLSYTATPPT